jgi:hypothetical protein
MRAAGAIALSLAAVAALAAADDGVAFDRYRIILVRQPFGLELPPPAPASSNAAAVVFARAIRLTGLVRDEGGTLRVGFTDTSVKKDYLLPVGGVEDGIEVIAAEYEHERARLARESQDYWVSMSGDVTPALNEPVPPVAPLTGSGQGLSMAPPRRAEEAASELSEPGTARWQLSYTARKRLRAEERRAKRDALLSAAREGAAEPHAGSDTNALLRVGGEALTPEELVQALREYAAEAQAEAQPETPPGEEEAIPEEGVPVE